MRAPKEAKDLFFDSLATNSARKQRIFLNLHSRLGGRCAPSAGGVIRYGR